MDNLFRSVFKNVIIRNQIFRFVTILNKDLIVKKYNQCNMGWIIKNRHFHLLLYKLKKHIKRDQFSEELFYKFLEGNSELDLLKEIFEIFPRFLPSTPMAENILIEHCSSLKPTENPSLSSDSSSSSDSFDYSSNQEFCEQSYDYASSSTYDSSLDIIKYLTNELNIKVTNKAIENACAANNCKIVGYYLGLNQLDRYKGSEINICENCNIGTLFCSLRGKDFQLFKFIFENNTNLTSQCINYDKFIKLMVATGDVRFIIYFGRVQGPSFKPPILQPYMIAKSSISIIKYLCSFLKINDSMYYKSLLCAIEKRKDQSERSLLLRFLIEEFRIYEKVEGSIVVQEVVYSFCSIGDLDCIIYLRDFYLTLPLNHSFKFLIPHSALDISISSKKIHVTDWILENTDTCCSINGLRYLCKNIAKLKHILNRILIKFVPKGVISSNMILEAMRSTNRIALDKENFDYLSSFLPNHLIPIFPIEISIEDYDY
ncbi:hypothetical protein ACTFIW_011270 [Dictyostelium discoideum]